MMAHKQQSKNSRTEKALRTDYPMAPYEQQIRNLKNQLRASFIRLDALEETLEQRRQELETFGGHLPVERGASTSTLPASSFLGPLETQRQLQMALVAALAAYEQTAERRKEVDKEIDELLGKFGQDIGRLGPRTRPLQ